ncbi:putative membrane protein [Nocardioides ginsengisegetis]|uniref:Putative membrane protein n=1 Tax=Nocardioides ginsengisegetis TaxID=661491 RepID=A0A7W3IXN1_9ACTN|nr:DUF2231 domain-containing protein [Nocardioides ginsengisegetis]MBA8802566.1 putative membrane protein [Nocardioides ginsengisegetis]
MEIAGLPLHPLVVHAAVVFGPLGALAALAYVVLPARRDQLRWPMIVLAAVATGSVVAAYVTGLSFYNSRPDLHQLPSLQTHKTRATVLFYVTLPFGVLAIVTGWLHARTGALRLLLHGLLLVAAGTVLVLVVLTGDAGARSVWGK